MKKAIIVLSLLLITIYIFAQTPERLWTSIAGYSYSFGEVSLLMIMVITM